jgi:ComF family protein
MGVACPSCRPGLPLFALGDHLRPLQQAVIGLKYRHVRRVAQWATRELVARQKSRILELSPSALVPVPLHSGREYFRGFNQAELLAEHLGEMLDLDVRCDLAVRKKHRRVQSRLSAERRFKNVRGVFQSLAVEDKVDRILIVDDVVTSGATVGELARVLREAGHGVVGVLAIAHRG